MYSYEIYTKQMQQMKMKKSYQKLHREKRSALIKAMNLQIESGIRTNTKEFEQKKAEANKKHAEKLATYIRAFEGENE